MGSRPRSDKPDKPVIPVLVFGWNNAVSDSRFEPQAAQRSAYTIHRLADRLLAQSAAIESGIPRAILPCR